MFKGVELTSFKVPIKVLKPKPLSWVDNDFERLKGTQVYMGGASVKMDFRFDSSSGKNPAEVEA